MDRIDIHVEVPRVDYEKLSKDRLGESSAEIRQRVESARQVQRERFAESSAIACSAFLIISSELTLNCGYDGNQPIRTARMFASSVCS